MFALQNKNVNLSKHGKAMNFIADFQTLWNVQLPNLPKTSSNYEIKKISVIFKILNISFHFKMLYMNFLYFKVKGNGTRQWNQLFRSKRDEGQ